jgi:peptidoglycan hydrolase-like protein with peptidoglycan-binding domain
MSYKDEEKSIGEESAVRAPQSSDGQAATPTAASPPTSPGPIPNGGLQAWLQVLGAWILFFNTWLENIITSVNALFPS